VIQRIKRALEKRREAFFQTTFGCLVRLFVGRIFNGDTEAGAAEMNRGVAVIVILLAMPGLLASLLMLEKYGSLLRFLRGQQPLDPFVAPIPDEYFFIVLSIVVTGIVALWRWDSLFLDRRDYKNLVPLPISLRVIFFANLCAILTLTGLCTFIVNAASLLLFPVAVTASKTAIVFLHFAAGHFVAVTLASCFSCFFVFAVAGLLMTILPAALFKRVSLFTRFLLAISLLALLGGSVVNPELFLRAATNSHRIFSVLPPVSFLGLARAVWIGSGDPTVASTAHAALIAVGLAFFAAMFAYAVSFRRLFIRIPETADAGLVPRWPTFLAAFAPRAGRILPKPAQRACYEFVARTLVRSSTHLQIVLGFLSLGIVVSACILASVTSPHSLIVGATPPLAFLSIPFVLSYCAVIGIWFAFDVPIELRANWIFRFWLDRDQHEARAVARCVLLVFSLSWLMPACFVVTLIFWGWSAALLHTLVLSLCTVALVELLLVRLRKIPFTCSYPTFQSNSGIIACAYLFGFVFFSDYLVQIERWCLVSPWKVMYFAPLLPIVFWTTQMYRGQMLEMDKELIFEEVSEYQF
jgi:hypothetical protein